MAFLRERCRSQKLIRLEKEVELNPYEDLDEERQQIIERVLKQRNMSFKRNRRCSTFCMALTSDILELFPPKSYKITNRRGSFPLTKVEKHKRGREEWLEYEFIKPKQVKPERNRMKNMNVVKEKPKVKKMITMKEKLQIIYEHKMRFKQEVEEFKKMIGSIHLAKSSGGNSKRDKKGRSKVKRENSSFKKLRSPKSLSKRKSSSKKLDRNMIESGN